MRLSGFNVAVAGGASGGWWWLHRREWGRTAGLTVHGAFRPVRALNSLDERAEGFKVARATHSPKHVLSEAGYVVCVLAVNTEVNLDVIPL